MYGYDKLIGRMTNERIEEQMDRQIGVLIREQTLTTERMEDRMDGSINGQ